MTSLPAGQQGPSIGMDLATQPAPLAAPGPPDPDITIDSYLTGPIARTLQTGAVPTRWLTCKWGRRDNQYLRMEYEGTGIAANTVTITARVWTP